MLLRGALFSDCLWVQSLAVSGRLRIGDSSRLSLSFSVLPRASQLGGRAPWKSTGLRSKLAKANRRSLRARQIREVSDARPPLETNRQLHHSLLDRPHYQLCLIVDTQLSHQ